MRELNQKEAEEVSGGFFKFRRIVARKAAVLKSKKTCPAPEPAPKDDDC